MSRMVSPNEMLEAAKAHMLDGEEPNTHEDWALIMNFLALNVHPSAAVEACNLMRVLYQMPLSEDEVEEIVQFQLERRQHGIHHHHTQQPRRLPQGP